LYKAGFYYFRYYKNMPLSDPLILINGILLFSVLLCGVIMLHASSRYAWLTGLPEQMKYQQRIMRLIIILVGLGLVASAVNLFFQ